MNISKVATFKRQSADTPVSELALRVLVEFAGGDTHVIGTAVIVAGHLAITARHNFLDGIVQRFGAKKINDKQLEVKEYAVRLYQITLGPSYVIWNVVSAWPSVESDIAFLHLALHGRSDASAQIEWRVPRVRVVPPPIGSAVVGFGYHSSKVTTTPNPGGGYHLELNDEPTATTGEVEEILPTGNPSGKYTFPCYRVGARFDGGMSGGPVFDDTGALCGIISGEGSPGYAEVTPFGYVTTLWPMLRTLISVDRGDHYPRGVQYPVIDLALDGLIHTVGLEALDPAQFPGRRLPR